MALVRWATGERSTHRLPKLSLITKAAVYTRQGRVAHTVHLAAVALGKHGGLKSCSYERPT